MSITSQSGARPHTYMENWYFFIHVGSASAPSFPNKHLSLQQSATVRPPLLQMRGVKTLLSSRLSQVSLWRGECKCVIYTCLVFYHDKAVHTRGKGGERELRAVAPFIACPVSFTRLWFSIMLLSAAVKRPAGIETNLSYSAFWFRSFSLSSLLLAYSFFTCDCQPVKVILKQSNPL